VRARPSYEAMLAMDSVPEWLAEPAEEPAGEPAEAPAELPPRQRGAA
jgi:hypothetical protein